MSDLIVSDRVHYVAADTPGEDPAPHCAAAIVTAVHDDGPLLVVLHPAGWEFLQDPVPAGGSCADIAEQPGSWHAVPAAARAKRKAATK